MGGGCVLTLDTRAYIRGFCLKRNEEKLFAHGSRLRTLRHGFTGRRRPAGQGFTAQSHTRPGTLRDFALAAHQAVIEGLPS